MVFEPYDVQPQLCSSHLHAPDHAYETGRTNTIKHYRQRYPPTHTTSRRTHTSANKRDQWTMRCEHPLELIPIHTGTDLNEGSRSLKNPNKVIKTLKEKFWNAVQMVKPFRKRKTIWLLGIKITWEPEQKVMWLHEGNCLKCCGWWYSF